MIRGRVLVLVMVTAAVLAGYVSLPVLAALSTLAGVLGAIEVSGALSGRSLAAR